MKNKIFKILSILSIIFISFFVKEKKIFALECTWHLRPTYIDFEDTGQLKISHLVNSNHALYILHYDSDRFGKNFVLSYKRTINGSLEKIETFSDSAFDKKYSDITECPHYVEVDNHNVEQVSEQDFSEYLRNQYSPKLTTTDSFVITIDIFSSNLLSINNTVIGSKVFTDVGSVYPTEHFNNMIKDRGATVDNLKNLQIDTNSSGMDKTYFESTKAAWYKYAESEIKNIDYDYYLKNCTLKNIINNGIDSTNEKCIYNGYARIFKKWFDNVSRWIFEEDYDKFKRYYRFANMTTMTQEEIDNALNIFEIDTKLENNESESNDLKSDNCLSLCPRNTTALTNCQKGTTYINCVNAQNACKNISSASAYQTCMKENMGESEYVNFINAHNERKNTITSENEAYRQELADSLSKIKAPDLDIDFEPYKVTCDDVSIFHTFYVILEIAAPILVILFGTIDYAKAVMASDLEKMQKAKKNFPKRLVALILFIFVPLIINLIISVFSPTTSTNLMYCIINGG